MKELLIVPRLLLTVNKVMLGTQSFGLGALGCQLGLEKTTMNKIVSGFYHVSKAAWEAFRLKILFFANFKIFSSRAFALNSFSL